MRSNLLTLLIPLLLLFPSHVLAKDPIRTIHAKVIKVSDGDTITVQDSLGTKVKVRLYGIDAPETEKSNKKTGRVTKPGQPYGEEAFKSLQSKIFKKQIMLDVMAVDQYKRSVGIVTLDGKSINEEMIAEGHAWAYRQYLNTPYKSEFIGLEEQARSKKLGLWKQSNPQTPWEFRRLLKNGKGGRAAW